MRIAINGAGVAGPALAYWLLKTGHEPVLIERAPKLREGGYIIDFWGLGYTIAEKMGILPAVRSAGYQVEEVRMVNAKSRRVGGFRVSALERLTHGRFTSLPRSALSRAIYDALEDRIETVFGDSITRIEERGEDVLVSFETEPPRAFDLVIGAGGLHSQVRALSFGPQSDFERDLGYRVAAFQLAGYKRRDELAYVGFASPGRQIARFSMRDDRTLILAVFQAQLTGGAEPLDLASRKTLLAHIFDGVGWEWPEIRAALADVEEVYYDRVSQIEMDHWSKGRVALIGDAAACVSLLAGEGTGLALLEAFVLAGELKRAANDHQQAFRSYEERLKPLIQRKQKSARDFAASFTPKTALGIWLRNQVTKLMAIPLVTELAIGRTLKDDFQLPDYGI
ncbi:MAG TPA: FAD-binding domain [Alphaproteobacteria bacterium]|nr:FAD-binding domain [Alphaproteobacteria bacterium]